MWVRCRPAAFSIHSRECQETARAIEGPLEPRASLFFWTCLSSEPVRKHGVLSGSVRTLERCFTSRASIGFPKKSLPCFAPFLVDAQSRVNGGWARIGVAWLRYARMRRSLTQTDGYLDGSLGGIACVALACVAWVCVAWFACSLSVGCASSGRLGAEEREQNASVASNASITTKAEDTRALVEALEELAAPWRDASGGLSLVREGHSAAPLRLVALNHELNQELPQEPSRQQNDGVVTSQNCSWRAEYRLEPRTKHRAGDDDSFGAQFDADARMVMVEERGLRLSIGGQMSVVRKFLVRGLASGRALTLDVPLEAANGDRLHLFVHGAEVKPEFGATHVLVELARDEATSIELRLIDPAPR